MRVVRNGFPFWQRALTVVCVVGLLLPVAGGAAADPKAETKSKLQDVTRELKGTRAGLQRIDGERSATMADLEQSQSRQAALDAQLQSLTADLGQAQTSLADADARLQQTTAELTATEHKLAETHQDLADAQKAFTDRARASYMYGGSGPGAASSVFGVEDVARFNQAVAYVQRVVAHDRQQVALVASLERQVEAARVELAELQQRRREERQVAAAERDRVAGLVSEQEELHDQAAAEADRHRRILAELDADKATHVALVDSLEEESEQLEAELARIAEEERRRAEEARRRAEEEARRVAAANAAARRRAEAAQAAAAEQRRRAEQAASRARPAPADMSPSGWRRPSGGAITSGYGMRRHPIFGTGRMHTGVDFGAPAGAPIYAVTDGVVVSAGWRGGYGLAVVIDHGGGLATLSAHASSLNVSAGQRVSRGQVIAATGSTGQSTGPHLHFEVRVNGQHRDPMPYF